MYLPTMRGVRFSVRNDRTGFIAYGCTITPSTARIGYAPNSPFSVEHLDCYVSGLRSFALRMTDVHDSEFVVVVL